MEDFATFRIRPIGTNPSKGPVRPDQTPATSAQRSLPRKLNAFRDVGRDGRALGNLDLMSAAQEKAA
jgi:hypothetical protein